MPTVFDKLSEQFYVAYFESDMNKRKKLIDKWIDSCVPVIQRAVKADLRSYIEQILETRWSTEGWQSGVKKFINRLDNYRLVMNIQIADTKHMKYVRTIDPVSHYDRVKTLRRAEVVLSRFDKTEIAKVSTAHKKAGVPEFCASDDNDNGLSGDRGGPSPNDERSDVMNPNNPAYQAAADNRSNQMNPNNPAYHSSRGHSRR